jgi:hypothetical protein
MAAIAGTPESDDELDLLKESIRQRQMQRDAATQDSGSALRDILVGVGSLGYGAGMGQGGPALAQSIYDRTARRDQEALRQRALEQGADIKALSDLAKQREAYKQRQIELPQKFALQQQMQENLLRAQGAKEKDIAAFRASAQQTIQDLMGKQKMDLQTLAGQQKLDQIKAQGSGKAAANTLGSARRNQVISNAGAAFDKDPILKQITTTNNSLDRATSIMNGTTPVTGKNFALLQQDMISAMAPGGAATEGKVNREMVETLSSQLNDLQTRFGSINDLRKEQPQVFAQLQSLINQVKHDYSLAGRQRVSEIATNYQDVPDDLVRNTVDRKSGMLNKKFDSVIAGNARVRVVSPDGKTGSIPQESLQKALAKGWRRAE